MRIVIRKDVYNTLSQRYEIQKANKNHGWHGRFANGKVVESLITSKGYPIYILDNGKKIIHKRADKDELRKFVKEALSDNKQGILVIDQINKYTKERLLEVTGKELDEIIVEKDYIRHSINKKEHLITSEDILNIRKIVNDKDTQIKFAGYADTTKLPMYTFEKRIRGEIIASMTVRAGNKRLALQSLYRKGKMI